MKETVVNSGLVSNLKGFKEKWCFQLKGLKLNHILELDQTEDKLRFSIDYMEPDSKTDVN